MIEPLYLTELTGGNPGIRRVAHGYATSGTWRRVIYRAANVALEVVPALVADTLRRPTKPFRMEDGVDPGADADRVALYVHYAPTGRVSGMVRAQLALLVSLGFAIVFISNGPAIPEEDWQVVRAVCALVVRRENFGRDFGAWREVMPEVRRRWPSPNELLLANDSVLGPIHPLTPVVLTMREGGDGLFGLTESLQGGAHLQSYFLLGRGKAVVADMMRFLGTLYVSQSKWLLVQMGEIRLARWMRDRGHRVAAMFGYDRVSRAAVADPAERRRLMGSHGKLGDLDRLPAAEAEALLHEWPLNPTQHLWHVLATKFGYPFLKTELVLRNPGRLPGVEAWREVVPADAPCGLPALEAHLRGMQA